uniref:VWFD domain-containing protein n=1 Tax=Biomphalaria glabrata TaxID=6526 RepID=A0A2C9K418_BIOGL
MTEHIFCTFVGGVHHRGTIPRCDTEGKVIVVPGITNDQCTCKCMNNEVVCDPDKCRRPTKPPKQPSSCDSQLCRDVEGCRVIPFPIGPCCKVCKGCRYRRRQYESDDTWRDPRDPCKQLSCKAGVVTVSKVQCFTHCHNALTIPGQCCPVCQGCFFRGKLYNESETFHLPTDVCTTCTCKNGNLQCERQQCPVLNCKSEYIYQPKSECCRKCRGSREIFVPTKGCFFKDYVYEENEKFSPEPCTQCVCRKKGTAICDKLICPPLDCPVEEQVPMNNTDCCKQCKEKRDCLFEGNGYKHKEEWRPNVCTRCSCVDGVTYCQREKCTNSLWCPQGYRLLLTERECCPRCIEHDAVCSVFGDPHYRTFDGLMYSFQGTCKYILAHDCVSNSFLVKVKNAVRFSSGYAWTQMLVVFLFNHRVSMLQNSVVKVDKVRARLPFVSPGKFSIFKEGSLVKMKSTIGVEVTWDGDSFLEVTVSTKYKQRMCGLCGNYNGIKTDDLLGKDGTMYMSGQQFGHTWRVGSKSACHIESDKLVKAPCEMNSTARLRAQQDCKIFYSHPFAKCRAKVDVNVYVSSCITDMCDCPHGRNCACEAILAYVSQCTRAGLDVKWYKPSSCLDR